MNFNNMNSNPNYNPVMVRQQQTQQGQRIIEDVMDDSKVAFQQQPPPQQGPPTQFVYQPNGNQVMFNQPHSQSTMFNNAYGAQQQFQQSQQPQQPQMMVFPQNQAAPPGHPQFIHQGQQPQQQIPMNQAQFQAQQIKQIQYQHQAQAQAQAQARAAQMHAQQIQFQQAQIHQAQLQHMQYQQAQAQAQMQRFRQMSNASDNKSQVQQSPVDAQSISPAKANSTPIAQQAQLQSKAPVSSAANAAASNAAAQFLDNDLLKDNSAFFGDELNNDERLMSYLNSEASVTIDNNLKDELSSFFDDSIVNGKMSGSSPAVENGETPGSVGNTQDGKEMSLLQKMTVLEDDETSEILSDMMFNNNFSKPNILESPNLSTTHSTPINAPFGNVSTPESLILNNTSGNNNSASSSVGGVNKNLDFVENNNKKNTSTITLSDFETPNDARVDAKKINFPRKGSNSTSSDIFDFEVNMSSTSISSNSSKNGIIAKDKFKKANSSGIPNSPTTRPTITIPKEPKNTVSASSNPLSPNKISKNAFNKALIAPPIRPFSESSKPRSPNRPSSPVSAKPSSSAGSGGNNGSVSPNKSLKKSKSTLNAKALNSSSNYVAMNGAVTSLKIKAQIPKPKRTLSFDQCSSTLDFSKSFQSNKTSFSNFHSGNVLGPTGSGDLEGDGVNNMSVNSIGNTISNGNSNNNSNISLNSGYNGEITLNTNKSGFNKIKNYSFIMESGSRSSDKKSSHDNDNSKSNGTDMDTDTNTNKKRESVSSSSNSSGNSNNLTVITNRNSPGLKKSSMAPSDIISPTMSMHSVSLNSPLTHTPQSATFIHGKEFSFMTEGQDPMFIDNNLNQFFDN